MGTIPSGERYLSEALSFAYPLIDCRRAEAWIRPRLTNLSPQNFDSNGEYHVSRLQQGPLMMQRCTAGVMLHHMLHHIYLEEELEA